ncbi:MAG: hypothetical protein PHN51_11570 [Candidatus Nanopelagicales bacterium]|nr:hypothetical protein [Candidatus Nanopelagicales bacterium]
MLSTVSECMTPDHEVLTDDGWKAIGEVQLSDFVAQWTSATGRLSFDRPSAVICKDHVGKMLHFTSLDLRVDQMVTPMHRMPVVTRQVTHKFEDCAMAYMVNYNTFNGFPVAGRLIIPEELMHEEAQLLYPHVNPHGSYVPGHLIKRTEEDYSGTVHCLTVKTGYFLVRRNNIVSITGNCLRT